jgi:hypothetical protein
VAERVAWASQQHPVGTGVLAIKVEKVLLYAARDAAFVERNILKVVQQHTSMGSLLSKHLSLLHK